MKKIYTPLFAAALFTLSGNIQAAGGPDAYGYTWLTSMDAGGPVFNWIDITSRPGVQTLTGLADDNSSASMINIGFSFHYYWNDYTQVKIGSNGWIGFDNTSNIASCFPSVPTPGGAADNFLAPLLSDLNFTGTGNPGTVKYWSNNIDTFIISYITVPFWSVSAPGWIAPNTFQVILCKADSSITYQYGTMGAYSPTPGCTSMTVGIENSSGVIGLQVFSDVAPPSNSAIKFFYPDVVLISIQDPYVRWSVNTDNKAEFIPNNTAFNLVSNFKNTGNTDVTTPIALDANVVNSVLSSVYSSSGSLPGLNVAQDTTYTFTPNWTPTVTGQYAYNASLTNGSDINTGNNLNVVEIEVVDICASSMLLGYNTAGIPTGSINWNGGALDDGVAVYFKPPVYPYTIAQLEYYIVSNLGDGYTAQIYDDDGMGGGPGTQLFNTNVPSASVLAGTWNTVPVSTPVTLNDGGFYVVWLQGGPNIFLGYETAGPRSRHNYEILDGSWATYRDNNAQDFYIRATINGFSGAPVGSFNNTTNELEAIFSNTSYGPGATSSWDFGDGSPASSETNPVHTYAAAGTYIVCLTVTNVCSNETYCDTVTVCEQPIAAWNSTVLSHTVIFNDNSSGTIHNWLWNFGDGNTSTQPDPTYTYAADGVYNVCLYLSDSCGYADTLCQSVTVSTVGMHEIGQTMFTAYPNPVKDVIHIDLSEAVQGAGIEILDITGQQVGYYPNVSGQHTTIDVSALSSDIYFLRLIHPSGTHTTYFIKQ